MSNNKSKPVNLKSGTTANKAVGKLDFEVIDLKATGSTKSNKAIASRMQTPSAFSTVSGATKKYVMPEGYNEIADQAWVYYRGVGIVMTCIMKWITYAIGKGVQITPSTSDDEFTQAIIDSYNEKYKARKFVRDMLVQLLVRGENIAITVDVLADPTYDTGGNEVANVIDRKFFILNSSAVKYEFDQYGDVKSAKIDTEDETGHSLDLDGVYRSVWNSGGDDWRGFSMVYPAFYNIDRLLQYTDADRTVANNWATPLRLIKIGGLAGDKLINPSNTALTFYAQKFSQMDPKSGAVVPWHVTSETASLNNSIPDIPTIMRKVQNDITIDFGLNPFIVMGDSSNYATAKETLRGFVVQLQDIAEEAIEISKWHFEQYIEFLSMQRGEDVKADVTYSANALSLTTDEEKKMVTELYSIGVIARETVQRVFGFDPEQQSELAKNEYADVKSTLTGSELAQLVSLGIIEPIEARDMLGIKDIPEVAAEKQAQSEGESFYASVDKKIAKKTKGKKCSTKKK